MTRTKQTISLPFRPARSRREKASAAAHQVSAALMLRVPDAMHATQAGARSVTKALQSLSDQTLRRFAALAIALGAALFVARAPRRAVAAALAALVFSVAIIERPSTNAIAS